MLAMTTGAKNESSAKKKCSTMANAKDSPQKPVVIFFNVCRCCNRTVLVSNHPVNIFKKEHSVDVSKVVVFLSEREVSFDRCSMIISPKKLSTLLSQDQKHFRIPVLNE